MAGGVPSPGAVGLILAVAFGVEVLIALLMPLTGLRSLSGWGAVFVLAIEVLAFLVPPLAVARIRRYDPVRTFRLRPPPWRFALPVLLAAPALSVVLYYLQELWAQVWQPVWPLEAGSALGEALTVQTPWQVLFLIVLVGLVPAVSEEVFFRGFVLAAFGARLRLTGAIGITAVLFAVMHMDFYGLPTYLVLGAWFGALAVISGSLFWPIVAHLLHNGLEVIAHNYLADLQPSAHVGWLPLVSGTALVMVALLMRRLRPSQPP